MRKKMMPDLQLVGNGEDIFVVVDGVKVAKRGKPGTPQAKTWISLEPGWVVRDRNYPRSIAIEHNGARVH
jgi:hypothetical protein